MKAYLKPKSRERRYVFELTPDEANSVRLLLAEATLKLSPFKSYARDLTVAFRFTRHMCALLGKDQS